MKTIIVSDLHNRVDWVEPFLSGIDFDRVVFLGDYFDDFHDTSKDIINAAKWLKQSLLHDNRIHLMGTHDMWYRFGVADMWHKISNNFLKASGNTIKKSEIINKILTEADWNCIKLYHCEQEFLLTHAGVHPFILGGNEFRQIIRPAIEKALVDVRDGRSNVWLNAGYVRGGIQPFGGITWLDWHYEFEIIPYLNQIVGHTELEIPEEKSTSLSRNYCIDTKNRHVGLLENGLFTWQEIKRT
jgi:hypothetical protein